jgi:ABC-type multidrug transport system permease subunit
MRTIRAGWILTQRELTHWVAQPAAPVFNLAFLIMLLLMFAFLFGGAIELPGGGDYPQFLLPGMFALTMLFGLESTKSAISEEAGRGITDRFRSMPIPSAGVVLGRAGADLASSVLSLAVLVIGGVLIGWRPEGSPGGIALGILLLLWLRFALLWIGVFIGLAFRSQASTTAIQVLVWPLGFLSSVFVSTETMPAWLGAVTQWNPVSITATAARQLFGNPTGVTGGILADGAVLLAFLVPLAITAVFLPLSARAYRALGD